MPSFGSPPKKSIRDNIVSVLSEEWPLSAKQLFGRVVKRSGCAVSYQAVHKAILQLVKEKVVQKQGKVYCLGKDWIENSTKFAKDLETRYASNKPPVVGSGYIETLFFDSFLDFAKFIINEFFARFPPTNDVEVCLMNHAYCPIGTISSKEHENLKAVLSKHRHYNVIRGNTFLDRLFADYFEKLGKRCILGRDYSLKDDVITSGNFVMFTFFSPEFSNLMEETYSSIKSSEQLQLDKIFAGITSVKTKITVLILENPLLANSLRQETLEIFSKAGK